MKYSFARSPWISGRVWITKCGTKNVPADETERLAQELSECAQISADLDQRMQNIRTRLADAELQHPQKQKKDEQILLDVLGL